MAQKTRRAQASKRDRMFIDPTPILAQKVKVTHDCSTGQVGFSARSIAEQRAKSYAHQNRCAVPRVIGCDECDSYHVDGVFL